MARYITLRLVNEQGTPHPWPGIDTSFEIGTEQAADKVWIGVSTDGETNQVYPIDTPIATILASWPRIYQGVMLNLLSATDDSPAQVGAGEYVYNNSLEDFNRLVAACCIAASTPESPAPAESPEPEMLTLFYLFTDNVGGGSLVITADGDEVLNLTNGEEGSIQVPEGSDLVITVDGGWDHSATLYEDGNQVDQASDTGGSPAIMNVSDVAVEYMLIAEASPMPPE